MDSPFAWHELATPDVEASKKFYNTVFGWTTDGMDMGEMGMYHMIKGPGDHFGGMMQTGGPGMENVPPHWAVYLYTEDVDATVASVTANGGSVQVPAMDVPMAGRMALCADPQGATFWVIKPQMPEG